MKIQFRCLPELEETLPPPLPSGRALPDWLSGMSMETDTGTFGADRTVKQCMPFIDAMTQGFVIPLPCDIQVEGGRFSWDWPYAESPLAFHFASQVADTPLDEDGMSVLKFINFWAIQTEPGVSILFVHPLNRTDLPFRTLSGLVDTDQFAHLPVHFPAQWTDPEFEGTLPQGTPIAHCIPVRREPFDIQTGAFSPDDAGAVAKLKRDVAATPGFYKAQFRGARDGR